MDKILEFLNKNNIEHKLDSKGVEYQGFYGWYFISNLQASSVPQQLMINSIKNMQYH